MFSPIILNLSDAVKKIILNYLQLISLARGLPLEWPDAIDVMFNSFGTLSSAGSNLLIPDCELSDMRTADAFFYKQIFYTFVVPFIFLICIFVWGVLANCRCCSKAFAKKHLSPRMTKNYCILSIVLLLFLSYPMLARLSFSMLNCSIVGNGRAYLMADLEEPCFEGRHKSYFLLLTIPQLILWVTGLPLAAFTVLHLNKHHLEHTNTVGGVNFRIRYGLLYMGYDSKRRWWEIVIAIRKVIIISIATFGALMGVTDLQAFVANFAVFIFLVVHIYGKPFDVKRSNAHAILSHLEFTGLALCFMTFWGGLIFYLGSQQGEYVGKNIKGAMTVFLILLNVSFLILGLFVFIKAYMGDRVKLKHRRETQKLTGLGVWRVQPVATTSSEKG